MIDIKSLTIKSARKLLDSKEISAEELRQEFLKLIKKDNKDLNAYLSVFDSDNDTNFVPAQSVLSGVPCAIKDNILINGKMTTAASKMLENYKATYDAHVVKKLKDSGAVFLGKANLDEFAMGSTTENSAFGVTKNPHDLSRVAGGSSGGSAAAVAAGLAVYALGTDTGGSIRNPASYCGIVGLKPTYGRVSRSGVIAMASSLDQVGPLTKNVEDAALVLNVIAGQDKLDSTTSPKPVPDFTSDLGKSINGLKIAVPKEFFGEGLTPEVKENIEQAIVKLEKQGAKIEYVDLPMTDYALAVYYIIVPSEVSANLARYDGIRYGHRTKNAKNLLDVYLNSRAEGFGAETRRRIMLGTYTLSAGYYDAYYKKAQQVRTLIKQDFDKIFSKYDAIVGPTMPTPAPKIGELDTPLSAYLADIYTVQVNLAGLPAISIPCGFADLDGKHMPIGLQIIGKHFDEAKILQIAYAFENS